MLSLRPYEFWFVTGSQHLYGEEALKQVEEHSRIMVNELNRDSVFPFQLIFKPVVTTPDEIRNLFLEANVDWRPFRVTKTVIASSHSI